MDDMLRGYLAGLKSGALELPDCHLRESVAYRHGWLNGRDDRLNCPRDRARVLLARADIIANATCRQDTSDA